MLRERIEADWNRHQAATDHRLAPPVHRDDMQSRLVKLWRRIEELIVVHGQAATDRTEPGPGEGRAIFRSAVVVVLAFAVGACATFAGSDEEEVAPPTPTVQDSGLLLPPIPGPSPSSGVLRGRSLLADGRYSEAVRQFEWVLKVEPDRESRADALWGLSLVHLLPDSPMSESDQADALLEALAEEFPDTLPGMQAVWLRSIFEDLRIATERAAANERAVRELEETLEQLRQIDLGRRPSGQSAPEPDS